MKLRKIFIILISTMLFLSLGTIVSNASDLNLNNLDFDARIHEDGSMTVTETWDISVYDTNTLFKTFKIDEDKYSSITNVTVRDITNTINEPKFIQIDEEMYHVTKNCFYALKNSNGDFEIAWGVGINDRQNKKFEITYTVKDAVAKYNDCSELYWQFLGKEFEIPADIITGKIELPKNASSKEDIKVWGHIKSLNGEIYAVSPSLVEFYVEDYSGGEYLEVRVAAPSNIIQTSGRIYNKAKLNDIIEEETKWANKANMQRMMERIFEIVILIVIVVVVIVLFVIFVKKIFKYIKIYKELPEKLKVTQKLEYFRELPDKSATPAEAVMIINNNFSNIIMSLGKIFSATMLNLALKKYIHIKLEKDENGKDKITIVMLKKIPIITPENKENIDLRHDEIKVLEFIKSAMLGKKELTLKELEKYIKEHAEQVNKLSNKIKNKAKENHIHLKNLNQQGYENYNKYQSLFILYIVFAIFVIYLLPFAIVLLINGVLCYKIYKKSNVLTQKGLDEQEKWKGLKKYMEDFSLLNEKEVPALEVWEHYLVFATAFGIAEKVIKQLKIVYPNIMEDTNINTGTYMYLMTHTNFNTSFSNSISSSITSANTSYSSGSGGGGGFSGGGGGRRPEEVVAVEDKKTVAFYTLGCKVNQYETNAMAQKFLEKGYKVVEFSEKADIYVVNTCTVTNMSDRKSRQILRRVKEKKYDSILVAVGCYVQVSKEELEKIPEIDLILGTNEKADIIKYVEEKIKEIEISDVMKQKEYVDFGITTYTEKTRAVIKVQDGCDRFCSYCIIPYARGRVRSRNPENVIEEIKEIAKNGLKEVVITGIHIASYGKDFKNGYELIDLLEEINKIDGIERIRLGSIEPKLITNEFVQRLKKLDKICNHFHLSLQSGCNETLKRMNRRYTTEEFEQVVNLLKENFDDVILTTDIIVGFPGETKEEFQKTYEFLKKIKFYKMHIFKYSQRKGTKADVMPNQVEGNIKEQRSNMLLKLSDKNEEEYNKEHVGKIVRVLFEEKEGEYYKGHTKNYILVKIKQKEKVENKILNVEIIEAQKDCLHAKIVEN